MKKLTIFLLIFPVITLFFVMGKSSVLTEEDIFHRLDGLDIKFFSLLDKPLFIVFWSTSCSSCIKEMPVINSLKIKDNNFNVLAISMNYDNLNDIKNFAKNQNFDFVYGHDSDNILTQKFNIKFTPTILKINMNGSLEKSNFGGDKLNDFFKIK